MKITRKILGVLFWVVALAAVLLVVVRVVPQIQDILATETDNGEGQTPIQLAEAIVNIVAGSAIWLVLAGVSIANVTLLRMLDAIEEL